MGAASKVFSVFLRVGELICSAIVLGIIARFLWRVNDADVYFDGRLVFGMVVACISAVESVICIIPFTFTFSACPLDFILFALWLVVFILFEVLTGINTCNSMWYYNYWGYYWGGFWRTPIIITGPWDIGWSGCSAWTAVLAWSFIASMGYLLSSILGLYVMIKYREEKKRILRGPHQPHKREGVVLPADQMRSLTPV